MFPTKNDPWIPVALSADVPKTTVVPAWLPLGKIALWRTQSGALAASSDRCPHRGMRLSYGFVRGETLSCIYHGWSFGNDGRCQRIPAHPGLVPPETINLKNSVVQEGDGIIWVAIEQPDTQPPTLGARVPLRSLVVAAGVDALQAAADAQALESGVLSCTLAGEAVGLLLVAKSADETLMHILVEQNATTEHRIMVSRAAEILRRKAEMMERGEAV